VEPKLPDIASGLLCRLVHILNFWEISHCSIWNAVLANFYARFTSISTAILLQGNNSELFPAVQFLYANLPDVRIKVETSQSNNDNAVSLSVEILMEWPGDFKDILQLIPQFPTKTIGRLVLPGK
jgi:hypothetical protein